MGAGEVPARRGRATAMGKKTVIAENVQIRGGAEQPG